MYYESWVNLACSKVFEISSQFISLHVLQILIPYSCQFSFLELLSWSVESDYLAWCFFIRSCRSLISMKVAPLLDLQVGIDMMVSHCLLMVWLKFGLCVEDCWSYFGVMNPHGLMYFWQTFLSSVLALVHVEDPYHHDFMVVGLRSVQLQ